MRVVNLKNVSVPDLADNDPPYALRPIPKKGMPLHHLAGVIGGTGSGKTTALLKFLMWYDNSKSFDRLIIFSPTLAREPKGQAFLSGKHNFEISYYKEYSDEIMMEERHNMLSDIEAWHKYQAYKRVYARFKRDAFSDADLEVLMEYDFKPPKWKYKTEHFPTFALVLDDHVGKRGCFNANCKSKLVEVCVEHRHLSLSIYLLSQVFANFIPKQLRGGCINMWMLFGTKSHAHMVDIAENLTSKITSDEFIEAWKFATKDSPHDFLFVDYKANDPNQMLRKNFDKLIQFV
jgi:hypothetical protein